MATYNRVSSFLLNWANNLSTRIFKLQELRMTSRSPRCDLYPSGYRDDTGFAIATACVGSKLRHQLRQSAFMHIGRQSTHWVSPRCNLCSLGYRNTGSVIASRFAAIFYGLEVSLPAKRRGNLP